MTEPTERKPVTFPPCGMSRSAGAPFVMEVPVINTAHFTREECDALYQEAYWKTHDDFSVILVIEDHESDYAHMKPETVAVIQHFARLSYPYLRLDPDGDLVEGLPTFDW